MHRHIQSDARSIRQAKVWQITQEGMKVTHLGEKQAMHPLAQNKCLPHLRLVQIPVHSQGQSDPSFSFATAMEKKVPDKSIVLVAKTLEIGLIQGCHLRPQAVEILEEVKIPEDPGFSKISR